MDRTAYNKYFGPVKSVNILKPFKHINAFNLAVAASAGLNYASADSGKSPIYGWGTGLNREEAEQRAVHECMERAAIQIIESKTFDRGRVYKNRGREYLRPDDIVPITDEQAVLYPDIHKKWSDNLDINWVEGIHLNSGQRVYLPAFSIYSKYIQRYTEENFFNYTSAGAAAHTEKDISLLKGILEVIERDAVMIRWHCDMPPPRIRLETIDDDRIQLLANQIMSRNLKVYCNLLTLDIPVPVVSCIIMRDKSGRADGPPYMSFGSAAGMDICDAIYKAILESLQVMHSITRMKPKTFRKYDEVISLHDHSCFYAYNDHRDYVTQWCDSGMMADLNARQSALQNDYPSISEHLMRQRKMDVYEYQFNPSGFDLYDLSVTKVFIPQMVPMNVKHASLPLRNARFLSYFKHSGTNAEAIKTTKPHPIC
jgi:thiazole/oxazole-forming peptide maturase SagD family component